MPAFAQNIDGEMSGHFAQMHGAQVVGLLVAGRGRCHVGNHQIRRAAQRIHDGFRRFIVEKIHHQQLDARNGRDFEKVDADHAHIVFRRAGDLGGNLRPAARCGAQVDDATRAFQDRVLLVDFQKLEGGAGAITLQLGALHIGIVDVALQPTAR